MRGAVFSILGDISGLTVLDAFAGSGALSFEAISRGAVGVLAIDFDRMAVETMKRNCRELTLTDKVHVLKATIQGWSHHNEDKCFDIILADPPYDQIPFYDIEKLPKHLNTNGTFVLSWPGRQQLPTLHNLGLIQVKDYGDGQLAFYKKVR